MNKEHNKRAYWIKSGLYSLFGNGVEFAFNFGSVLILLRLLSVEDMGAWVLFLTVCSFLEVTRIGLLQNALVKYVASHRETHYANILTASAFLNIALTCIYILLLIINAKWLSQVWENAALEILFYIYAITTLLLFPFHQMQYIQQANLDFKGIFWARLSKQGVFFAYLLWVWVHGISLSLPLLAIVQILGLIVGLGVALYFSYPYLQFSKRLDWHWVKTLFHFGKYATGTNLSSMLYKSMDKIMLGRIISVSAVAIYELAIKITNLLDLPTLSAAPVVFPQSAMGAARNGHQAAAKLYEQSVGLILTIIIPCILIVQLFPETIIYLIGGSQYLDSVPILRIVILFGLFTPFLYQTGVVLESIGKPKVNFYFTVVCFFINIVCNLLFIKAFGIIGAAYGTLLTYIIAFIIGQILLHYLVGVSIHKIVFYFIQFYRKAFSFLRNPHANIKAMLDIR